MATETQIINIALTWMGQNLINTLTDNQNEAKIMNANYATSRDKVVADHAWSFALDRQILSPVVTQSVFGAPSRFLIPSEVLRVWRVYRPTTALRTQDLQNANWVREGNHIVSREIQIWAHFIIRVTNTNLFSPQMAHAIAAQLAADTCMAFTESVKLTDRMETKYETKLADAIYADGSQGRTEVIRSTRLTGVRTR